MKNKNLKETLNKIIREEYENHVIMESMVNWLLDKGETFIKSHFNHVQDYQYSRLFNDPEFRALSKNFGMNEKEFTQRASKLIRQNPKRFEKLLAYDIAQSRYKKYLSK